MSLLQVNFHNYFVIFDRNCSLVFRVTGYSPRGLGFDPRPYQIFWVELGLERGPVSQIEELLERKSSGLILEHRD
jgi:hypothetical protein